MDLAAVSNYLKLQKHPNHTEVIYNGAPCLVIMESSEGYTWAVIPLFARMIYGANTYADIPYAMESFGDMEEAIADGVAKLHELGAFIEYDIDSLQDDFKHAALQECTELAVMYAEGNLLEAANYLEGMIEEAFAHPNHKKLDKNKNGKLDKEDFQILRGEKKAPVAEEVEEQLDEVGFIDKLKRHDIAASKTNNAYLDVITSKDDADYNKKAKRSNRYLKVSHGSLIKKLFAPVTFAKKLDLVKESEEQLDEVENAFMSVFGPKKTTSSYDLPGHATIHVKSGPDGETHVKRISKEGHVTTTKYNSSGAAIGKIKHDDEDPKPHFKAAGVELEAKPKLGKGRPPKAGHAAGSSHEVVKAKIDKGESLSRYEKYIAQKHGLMDKGKAGRKGKELDDAGSEKLFKTLALRSLKKAEKGTLKTEATEQLDELSNETLKAYKDANTKKTNWLSGKANKRFGGFLTATRKQDENDAKAKAKRDAMAEEVELDEAATYTPYKSKGKVTVNSPGHRLHGAVGEIFHKHTDGRVNATFKNAMTGRKGDVVNVTLKPGEFKLREEVEQIEEKITPNMSTKDIIKDFIDSDAPQFKGKSKAQRIRMALGAAYSAREEAGGEGSNE